jgi:hypothetical protein
MACESSIHILLVSFPAQGHVNSLIQLGKHLAARGCFVTFSTTEKTGKEMQLVNDSSPTPIADGFLNFDFFNDGLEENDAKRLCITQYVNHFELVGKDIITQLIKKYSETKNPISCFINNPFVPWACDAAIENKIPFAMHSLHSTATFLACFHYFKKLSHFPTDTDPYSDVQLPGIVLKHNEIPDFLHPFCPIPILKKLIMDQFSRLTKTFCVLIDTFEELEKDQIDYLSKFYNIRAVGPLFKSPKQLGPKEIRGDFLKADDDCIAWLNTKPPKSVVYISLGTIVSLSLEQLGEFAHGILNSEVSFLWVVRSSQKEELFNSNFVPEGFLEKTSDRGKIVKWCSQEKVLAHPSVACFLSHCGWNSTIEALASGVPVLTFSQIGDQLTNAKFIVDVFKIGIRVSHSQSEKKIVKRDEMKQFLLDATVGPEAEELRQNALKWKIAAEAARADGGSSERNLDAFVEDIKNGIIIS